MSKTLFLDANIILDFFDNARPSSTHSSKFFEYVLQENYKLYTSCDIITTLYYVSAKQNKAQALTNIQNINKILSIIEFSNEEVEKTCALMMQDKEYTDLEDTIQYLLAKKANSDYIISNDKSFTSKDIKLLNSKEFCEELGI